MNSKKRPCSIVRVEHEIIEQQVLMSLSDKAKVALVLDARGLSEIIHARLRIRGSLAIIEQACSAI